MLTGQHTGKDDDNLKYSYMKYEQDNTFKHVTSFPLSDVNTGMLIQDSSCLYH